MTLETNYDGNNLLHYVLPTTGREGSNGYVEIRDAKGVKPSYLGSKDTSLFIDLDEDIRVFREGRNSPDRGYKHKNSPIDIQNENNKYSSPRRANMGDEVKKLGEQFFE